MEDVFIGAAEVDENASCAHLKPAAVVRVRPQVVCCSLLTGLKPVKHGLNVAVAVVHAVVVDRSGHIVRLWFFVGAVLKICLTWVDP